MNDTFSTIPSDSLFSFRIFLKKTFIENVNISETNVVSVQQAQVLWQYESGTPLWSVLSYHYETIEKSTAFEAFKDSKLIMMCNSIAPNVNRHEICHTRNTVFSQIQSDLSQNEITLATVNLWKVRFKKLKKKNKPTRNVMRIKKSPYSQK